MRKQMFAAGMAAMILAAIAVPAARGDDVTVALDNPGGSRTLYVENLLGAPLTTLEFGSTRAQPFRVRVVDSTMDRTGFTVSASMSNLYLDRPGGLDFSDSIASANISISHPANPLNVLDVDALVAAVFDTVSTIGDPVLCAALSLVVVDGACTITMTELNGLLQNVPVSVNLGDLAALPLIPQGSQVGSFDNPVYEGVAANAPQPAGAPAPTTKEMMKGIVSTSPETFSAIDAALATLVGGLTITETIDSGTLTASLRSSLGTVYDTLSSTQIQTILEATVATARNVAAEHVLGQTGTYLSLPLLTASVPADASVGTFRGTLVVTGLQP